MSDKHIEVDFYVMGAYRGKKKIGCNSICGRLLSGDLDGALTKTSVMVDDLNNIPGVRASQTVTTPAAITKKV